MIISKTVSKTNAWYDSVLIRAVNITVQMISEIVIVFGLCHGMRYALSVIRTEHTVSCLHHNTLFDSMDIPTDEKERLKRFSVNCAETFAESLP
jgi:hypothetical protein